MSRENIEVVRAIYEAWAEGGSARHLIEPDMEYVNPPYALESGRRRGRGTLGKIRDVYPDFRVEPERYVDAGEDVVVIGIARGTAASGVEAQWRQGYIWTIRDGKPSGSAGSTTLGKPSKLWGSDQALEAAGLRE